MLSPLQFIFILVVIFSLYILLKVQKKKAFINREFPLEWKQILEHNTPVYSRLPATLQAQLHQHILQFISEKKFYGCNGLTITDEIKVTIAGEACMLLLNRQTNQYYKLHYILVYPSSFITDKSQQQLDGTVSQQEHHLLGESWDKGKVILSWDDVLKGAKDFTDGQNVVLHEFAHQLDQESGTTNGAPLLGQQSSYQRWSCVLSKEFTQLQYKSEHNFESLIDTYGATNPAEFFAVVTETFFERPSQLASMHPELFEQFKAFYAVDPREWI